jgi:hypothetical protein
MISSEKLLALAAWLEDSNNELLVEVDGDDNKLAAVAEALIGAADVVKNAAKKFDKEILITAEELEILSVVAGEFDNSGDEELIKQANAIDELLYTISNNHSLAALKKAQEDKIEQIKDKYKAIKPIIDDINKISDAVKDVKESHVYQPTRVKSQDLSQRNCPDHNGVGLVRIGEGEWQCSLDRKVYSWSQGFTDLHGKVYPPQGVENQSRMMLDHRNESAIFDSRASRLGLEQ